MKRLTLLLLPLAMFAATDLSREVRHELVTLPYYGVFDNLAYRVDGRACPWVRASPRRGRLPRTGAASEADAVEVSVSPEGLAAGVFETTLTLSTWQGVNAPTVNVRLVVD